MTLCARRRPAARLALAAILLAAGPPAAGQPRSAGTVPPAGSHTAVSRYQVVRAYPHDPQAFTQGLEYAGGFLYEGTGLNGRSTLRKVDLDTGRVLQEIALAPAYFGEGITIWRASVLQLTWQAQLGFIYDLATFHQQRTFGYSGEGWGLTHDATAIIMSDGTASLRFLDPATLAEKRRLLVTDAGVPIKNLNELESVGSEIYANVWQTDFIARISPASGRVLGWIDLRGLLDAKERTSVDAVLNGIAYDRATRRLFVTGKLWPKLFQITLRPS